MKKKILAIIMTATMVMSCVAGCGKSEADAQNGDQAAKTESTASTGEELPLKELTLPLCEEKQELTVWLCYSGTVMKDLNEIEGVKKMEELTNVHINWIPINQDDAVQKFGVLISSGDLPDIIYPVSYPGGEESGVEEGIIYPDMDTLIENYMPNYKALLATSDEARREATADSGKRIVCRTIVGQDKTAESEGTYQGLAYRADLLEDLGLDVPTTIDEWHDALVKAKEAGIATPFVLDNDGGSALALSWGVGTQNLKEFLQLEGDKIVCGPAKDSWKGYLDTMKQWYSEGLINPNFTTFHYYLDTPASVQNNDTLLYSMVLSAFTGNSYSNYHMVDNDKEFLQPIVAPALNPGDEPVQLGDRKIAKGPIFISTSCKNPELAAKWLDFQYTEEGQYLNWYGIEGETYTIGEDGTPQYTDLVLHNPDGLPATDVLQKYALNQGSSFLGKHDISASWKLSSATAGDTNYELEAVKIWSSPETNMSISESLTLTAEESKIQTKFTDIQTMIDEYTINYITGQDVKPYEEYVNDLYAFGLQEVIDTYQAAYDRYLQR
ncbi:extracellular solute-binding protein [Butyrivibrio sp. AD3002]|uniref:extracellular solute-binding protein n=1 Tax=Butyrivibrio sp. AD3002 TaxID=1280670 RepID=UPI0003B42C0B|nr:extracellular solute-binding protein [Butyrivibrio sp. AD3002]